MWVSIALSAQGGLYLAGAYKSYAMKVKAKRRCVLR